MFKVEIYEKKTGRVVEVKEFKNASGVKDWAFWFDRQGDKENYGWRRVAS